MINYLHDWYDGINDCHEYAMHEAFYMYLEAINDEDVD